MTPNGHLAPGPRHRTPVGFLRTMRRDPIAMLMDAARCYGDVVTFRYGPTPRWSFTLVVHPEHVKHILQDNNHNYVRGVIFGRVKVLAGDGLITTEGEFWRRQRRLAQPAFHRARIGALATLMTEATETLLARWAPHAASGAPLDIADEMKRLTLAIAGRALFGIDLSDEADRVSRDVTIGLEFVNRRMHQILPLPMFVPMPTPAALRFRRSRRALDRIVYGIIAERRASGRDTGDLLSMLLATRDEETGEAMSDRQLRDEVMTFLFAGHETTAVALSWTWYLLSRHPEIAGRLADELRRVLAGRVPALEDLPALPYTRQVIEEAMRLYPPAWGNGRQAVAEDTIDGFRIPAGTLVGFSPYVTHRHPALWENPEAFDPDRFAPERTNGRPRYAYFPFGGGPHRCIGEDFALLEAQLVVATIAQRYRFDLVPGHPVVAQPLVALRPRDGVLATLRAA
jgi:cytochrome P450